MATISWKSGVSGAFSDAADWTGGVAPGSADAAALSALGTYTVTDSSDTVVDSLSTAAGATLAITGGDFQLIDGTGSQSNAGTITVTGDATLEISGTFSNYGSVVLNSDGGYPSVDIDGAVSLTGSGRIDLDSSGGGLSLIVGDASDHGTLTNNGNTIDGSGQIGENDGNLTLDNASGVIEADVLGATLNISTGNLVTNSATLEAKSGGQLSISDSVANTDGTILALASSTVGIGASVTGGLVEAYGAGAIVNIQAGVTDAEIEARRGGAIEVETATLTDDAISARGAGSSITLGFLAVVSGGTLTAGWGGAIQSNGGALDGSTQAVTLNAGSTLQIVDGSTMDVKGTLVDAGEIVIGDATSAAWTELYVSGQVSLKGGGLIEMTSAMNGVSWIFGDGSDLGVLTNNGDTIAGAGGIGANNGNLTLDNASGVIEANVAGATLSISTGNAVTNSAILEAKAGGQLSIFDSVGNTDGAIVALAASTVNLDAPVTGGVVEAYGAGGVVNIQASVTDAEIEARRGGAIEVVQATLIDDAISVRGAGSSLTLGYLSVVSGGTLTANWTGAIQSNGGTLDGSTEAVTLNAGSALQIVDNTAMYVKGTLVDAGEIVIGDATSAAWTELYVSGQVSLKGGGLVELTPTANGESWIFGDASDPGVLTNDGDTIAGAGGIGANDGNLTLDNASGVIEANVAAATLGISTGNEVANSAVLEANSGGQLSIYDSVANTGGVIVALAASTVNIYASVTGGIVAASGAGGVVNVRAGVTSAEVAARNGGAISVQQATLTDDNIGVAGAGSSLTLGYQAVVSGGTLSTGSAGAIQSDGGTLDGTTEAVTLSAGSLLQIDDNTSMDVKGALVDAGEIAIGDAVSSAWTELVVSGAATLSGGGLVELTAAANGYSWIWGDGADPGVLTNNGDRIEGVGEIGDGGNLVLTYDNLAGTVEAIGGVLQINTGNLVDNSGTLEAADGAQLWIYDNVNNTGGVIKSFGGSQPSVGMVILSGNTTTGGKVEAVGGTVEAKSATFSGVALVASDSGGFAFDDAVISGGSLSATGSAYFDVNSYTTLDGGGSAVTLNAGVYLAVASTTLTLRGQIVDKGVIAAMSEATPNFDIDGAVSLSGGGALYLSSNLDAGVGSGEGFVYGDATDGGVLTNKNVAISGDGQIGGNGATLQLINNSAGVIDATGDFGITIETGATVTNAGTLEATNPFGLGSTGGLTIEDSVANSGTIFADGGNVTAVGALTGAGKVEISAGGTATLEAASSNNVLFNGAGGLVLDDAPGLTGKILGFATDNAIDLAEFAYADTSITKIKGTGAAGTVTAVTLLDNDPSLAAPVSVTLLLFNQVAGQYGTSASDYMLGADSHGTPGTLFQLAGPHA